MLLYPPKHNLLINDDSFLIGDLCAAKFSDGEWYRARVEKVAGAQVQCLIFSPKMLFLDQTT